MVRAQENLDQSDGQQGLAYEPRVQGVDGSLRDTIVESLNLFRLRDRHPSSLPALQARLDADLELVDKILKSEGYYGYRVEHRIDTGSEPIVVDINVDPGPAYRLTRYDVHYLDASPAESDLPVDPAKLGATLTHSARAEMIVNAQSRLIRLLGEQGHPYAVAEKRTVLVHHDDQTVTVSLEMRAGPRVTFGSATVEGSERVEPEYIRRLANMPEGDTFNLNVIDEGRRRLFATGLFDSVTINWPQEFPGRPQVPMMVEVREREIRTIAAGLYYSTTEGAGIEASWTHRNLFGRGERVELGTRIAELELSAYADFLKPNVGRLDQNITARADLKDENTDAYDQRSVSATVGVQRQLTARWKASLATGAEAARIREVDRPKQNYVILSLPGQLAYDGSDNFFDPSKGFRTQFDASPNQVLDDSTARFFYGSIIGTVYHEVWPNKRVILAARGRLASLIGADTEDIPASRRLYAGGGGSIRGYKYQSVGPLDANNRPTGGRSLVEMSFEARVRITETIGIVPFIDGGIASEDSWPSSDTLQWAAGLGFRYYTPIGPLRLDIATPLNPRPKIDDDFAVYVSLGQAF